MRCYKVLNDTDKWLKTDSARPSGLVFSRGEVCISPLPSGETSFSREKGFLPGRKGKNWGETKNTLCTSDKSCRTHHTINIYKMVIFSHILPTRSEIVSNMSNFCECFWTGSLGLQAISKKNCIFFLNITTPLPFLCSATHWWQTLNDDTLQI